MTTLQRIRGAILGLACGDALGAPVEFKSPAQAQSEYGHVTEMVGSDLWAPGEWTDDTGMTLCLAEAILENPLDPIPGTGERFLRWQKTAKDVGSTISAALNAYRGDWVEASRNTPQARSGKAGGNGSLMRVLPVALAFPNQTAMLTLSARQSAMTHWDPQAEMCCAVYCLWIELLLQGQDIQGAWAAALERARTLRDITWDERTPGPSPLPEQFFERLGQAPNLQYHQLQPTGYAGYSVECLEAAVWCCVNASSLEETLVSAVNLAGEADTIAAVAGGAAGAHFGAGEIPERWLAALHQRAHLEEVASGLEVLRRHNQTYSTDGLPAFEISQVTDRIFAGRNPLTEQDIRALAARGVTHVLDLREECEWSDPKLGQEAVDAVERHGLSRLNVPVVDVTAPDQGHFDLCYQYLHEALAEPDSRVYVHCRAGRERTAAILVAYWARQNKLDPQSALAQLQAHRPTLNPVTSQLEAVRRWLGAQEG